MNDNNPPKISAGRPDPAIESAARRFEEIEFPKNSAFRPKNAPKTPVDSVWLPSAELRLERRRRRTLPGHVYVPQQRWHNLAAGKSEWRDLPIVDAETGENVLPLDEQVSPPSETKQKGKTNAE